MAVQKDAEALDLLEQAVATAPQAARPRMALAELYMRQGQGEAAWRQLHTLAGTTPLSLPLFATALVEAAQASGHLAQAQTLLLTSYAQAPSLDLVEALIRSGAELPQTSDGSAREADWYAEHLRREPSLVAAARWLAQENLEHEQLHPHVQRALDHAAKPLLRYRCAACGFEAQRHFWQCPGCQAWDSYPPRRVEEL